VTILASTMALVLDRPNPNQLHHVVKFSAMRFWHNVGTRSMGEPAGEVSSWNEASEPSYGASAAQSAASKFLRFVLMYWTALIGSAEVYRHDNEDNAHDGFIHSALQTQRYRRSSASR
jgi:hypothetical protein